MSKRILVMEDEKDNRQIIRDMLGGIDCEITEAEDAEQALAAIAKERPDLILMGIHLPIMNGYTVTRQNQSQSRVAIDPRHRHHLTCAGWGRTYSASSGM